MSPPVLHGVRPLARGVSQPNRSSKGAWARTRSQRHDGASQPARRHRALRLPRAFCFCVCARRCMRYIVQARDMHLQCVKLLHMLILLPLDQTLLAERIISANCQPKLAYHTLIQHSLGRLKDGRFVEIFCSLMGGRFDVQNSWQRLESIIKSLLRCQSE